MTVSSSLPNKPRLRDFKCIRNSQLEILTFLMTSSSIQVKCIPIDQEVAWADRSFNGMAKDYAVQKCPHMSALPLPCHHPIHRKIKASRKYIVLIHYFMLLPYLIISDTADFQNMTFLHWTTPSKLISLWLTTSTLTTKSVPGMQSMLNNY